ncbi:hypothetical protein MHYP_G00195710 [Metynnis hypsauchen]
MPAKKAVMAQKESATEENRQASSFADSSTTGATGTATDIERVCELLQTFMSEQRSKDESIQREMARQEQRWRSLQHQFGLLQREVQKGQFTAETSDTREEEQERQTQTRILRSSQSAVLTQPQQPEQLPAQMVWPAPRMPVFRETDDIEHFLTTFERLAQAAQWPVETWAFHLIPLLEVSPNYEDKEITVTVHTVEQASLHYMQPRQQRPTNVTEAQRAVQKVKTHDAVNAK